MKQINALAAALLAGTLVALLPVGAHAQPAAGSTTPQTCEQISAEIQEVSGRMQALTGGLPAMLADQQAALQAQIAASGAAGLSPIPFVGGAATAGTQRRLDETTRRTAATNEAIMRDMPAIAARMEQLALLFQSRGCEQEFSRGGNAAAPAPDGR